MKNLKFIILPVAVVAIGAGLWWWEHEKVHPSSDDAYAMLPAGADPATLAQRGGGRAGALG